MSNFMEKLKERIAEKEKKLEDRLEEIMSRPEPKKKKNQPTSPSWIDPSPVSTISQKKSSITGLLSGEVETKSSTKRS